MDSSEYKDYILTLLFMKYVTDKFKNKGAYEDIKVFDKAHDKDPDPEKRTGCSFDDFITLKGKKNIGEGMDKIIARLADENTDLKGVIDIAHFNDEKKLGSGKEMVDKLTDLISIFQRPELDFSRNKAEGDDIIGDAYEYLMRKFATESGKSKGQFYTPAEVSRILANVVGISHCTDSSATVCDGACGTGGMLTVAQARLLTLAGRRGKNVSIHLFGQEVQPETYAICKADMLLKGDGEEAEHIFYGSTLSLDGNPSRQFDFMLSNPPYGKSWKTDADKMGGKSEILDTRFNAYLPGGEELKMIPRTSDGQLLFLLNNVSKMKTDTELGSRIIEVHNGSSLFTGDAGSGESNARRYMIERDLVEAIIALPDNMFYNTGIGTYIWVLSNKKEERRKGKIQLIDATNMKSSLRKNMGNKNCEFTPEIRKEIVRIFLDMEESDVSMIFDNSEFGYWNVTVERPLRLRVFPEREIPEDTFKKQSELDAVREAIAKIPAGTPLDDWDAFAKATKLKKTQLKKIRPFITETDPHAKEVEGESDPNLRDSENIPFNYDGGIDAFIEKEVKPYAPDAYVDESKTRIGYEISFTKYFYKPVQLRDMKDILASLEELERESDGVMDEIVEGLK